MHPHLLASLDALVEHYREDPRCLAMCLHGSIGRGETDAYSDVDVGVVVRDECHEEVRDELRGVCERLCGRVEVWLPEGEAPAYCNHAFLFRGPGGDVLLCDFEVVAESVFRSAGMHADRVLFDHSGILAEAGPPAEPPALDAAGLARWIDHWWVYAYLDGKYYRRGNLYKMLYVQAVLFNGHVQVLRALYPAMTGRWAFDDVRHLPAAKQQAMLAYFGATTLDSICAALAAELDAFSADARAACEALGAEYPAACEAAVREHLAAMGVLH